jgi:hypothetical protein
MPWNLQRGDLQRLTDIVGGLHGFDVERDRRPILMDALGPSDRARSFTASLALEGAPDEVARRIIQKLVDFGPLEDDEEALELFLIRSVVPKVDLGVGEVIRDIIKKCKTGRRSDVGFSWPEPREPLSWPMADHTGVREAFAGLLARDTTWRFLPIVGPSETGKSHITNQMLANALRIPGLACGRFDFKGTTGMDNEVRAFVRELGVPLPPAGRRLNERLGSILDELNQRVRPALLIFDTYEVAGKAQDWVERQLLPSLIRATWLRVVITGQGVPELAGAVWASVARAPLQLVPPPPADWFEFGKQHRPDLTLALVEDVCRLAVNKASLLAQLLGPKMSHGSH